MAPARWRSRHPAPHHGRQAPLSGRQRVARRQSRPLSGPQRPFQTRGGTSGTPGNPCSARQSPLLSVADCARSAAPASAWTAKSRQPAGQSSGCCSPPTAAARRGPPVEVAPAVAAWHRRSGDLGIRTPPRPVRHRCLAVGGPLGVRVGLSAALRGPSKPAGVPQGTPKIRLVPVKRLSQRPRLRAAPASPWTTIEASCVQSPGRCSELTAGRGRASGGGGDLGIRTPPRSSGTAAWPSGGPLGVRVGFSAALRGPSGPAGAPHGIRIVPQAPLSQRRWLRGSAAPPSARTAIETTRLQSSDCCPRRLPLPAAGPPVEVAAAAAACAPAAPATSGIRTPPRRQAPPPGRQQTPRRQSRPLSDPQRAFRARGGTPGYPRNPYSPRRRIFPAPHRWPRATHHACSRISNNNSTPALRRRRGTLRRWLLPEYAPSPRQRRQLPSAVIWTRLTTCMRYLG